MKIKLHRFLSRTQITNLATMLSEPRVDGLKVKPKLFIKALACIYGNRTPEAYLDAVTKFHEEAFSVVRKEVMFDYTGNETPKLVSVILELRVRGYWTETVRIHDGIIGEDGYLLKCEVQANIGGGGVERDTDTTAAERMEYSQVAANYAFDICHWINENKKSLRPSDFSGWDIKSIGKNGSKPHELVDRLFEIVDSVK